MEKSPYQRGGGVNPNPDNEKKANPYRQENQDIQPKIDRTNPPPNYQRNENAAPNYNRNNPPPNYQRKENAAPNYQRDNNPSPNFQRNDNIAPKQFDPPKQSVPNRNYEQKQSPGSKPNRGESYSPPSDQPSRDVKMNDSRTAPPSVNNNRSATPQPQRQSPGFSTNGAAQQKTVSPSPGMKRIIN